MIYLDHAAATPVSRKAEIAMRDYFSEQFFNPSALYLPAKHVRENYEYAKDRIAHTIGAKGVDLIITAGATESINLAFTAISENAKETQFNYFTKRFSSLDSNLSESINSYTQFDYVYDTNYFTQNLECFHAISFLSTGKKIIKPQELLMIPYFKN